MAPSKHSHSIKKEGSVARKDWTKGKKNQNTADQTPNSVASNWASGISGGTVCAPKA